MKKLAVFVSGSGSDLQSIIDSATSGQLPAEIAVVVASKDGIFALERARKHGIPSVVYCKNDFNSAEEMYDALTDELVSRGIDFIVLAGYLTILTPNIVRAFERRIINIHPSLIPKYCGDGFYGMRVHEAVIKNGEKESGATVHFVDEGTDTGEIIMQESVPVLETDTAETLQKRVLTLEHSLLPRAIKKIITT